MTDRNIPLRDKLLGAAVLFGDGGSAHDVEFRLAAYEALLKLAGDLGDQIEEFDLTVALEELGSFKPKAELRRIANSLGLLERHGEGLLRLRRNIRLDDVRPGEYPFTRLASISTDFIRAPAGDSSLTSGRLDIPTTLKSFVSAARKAIAPEKLPAMPAFFRLISGQSSRLEGIGATPATTPFIDLYTVVTDIAARFPDIAAEEVEAFRRDSGAWIAVYLSLLVRNDRFGDDGALLLSGDDDYPGADRPTVPSSAALIPVLMRHAAWLKEPGHPECGGLTQAVTGLARFVLSSQNEDGGWPVYRYRSTLFKGMPSNAASEPLFSFLPMRR
jgi:hypothetical protein